MAAGLAVLVGAIPAVAQAMAQSATDHHCTADLARTPVMRDIASNALVRGLGMPPASVTPFLDAAQKKYATGPELLRAAAEHFKLEEAVLVAEVERFKHCNCRLVPMPDGSPAPALATHICDVDLTLPGDMRVIVSNALLSGLGQPDPRVRTFLASAQERYATGQELLAAAAKHFKLEEAVLAAEVEKYKHCNCTLDVIIEVEVPVRVFESDGGFADGALPADSVEVSAFAKDVTLHVVLHEMGHALIREFDIPILGNEETAADAFATYYLTTYMPDRAVDVLTARTTSLMIEANETPDMDWKGEHDDDARRAFQIAALAVAADPVKYAPVAAVVGMSEEDLDDATDYGAENRRSWRRVLGPLWMPDGVASSEARVVYDASNPFLGRLCAEGLAGEIEGALRRFDWHSQVTVRFNDGDGGAGWSRSSRTVTVNSEYVRRFIGQGERGLAEEN